MALEAAERCANAETRKSQAGRKPVDEIVMFKVLVLQALYDLSDDAAEYQCGFRFDRAHYSDLMPRSVPI